MHRSYKKRRHNITHALICDVNLKKSNGLYQSLEKKKLNNLFHNSRNISFLVPVFWEHFVYEPRYWSIILEHEDKSLQLPFKPGLQDTLRVSVISIRDSQKVRANSGRQLSVKEITKLTAGWHGQDKQPELQETHTDQYGEISLWYWHACNLTWFFFFFFSFFYYL